MYAVPGERPYERGFCTLAGDNHTLSWVLDLTAPEREVYAAGYSGLFRPQREPERLRERVREARASEEHLKERQHPTLDLDYPQGFPRPLVRYFDLNTPRWYEHALPCYTGHSGQVERCPERATMFVYGPHFCAVHGAEIAIGAREELTQDAANALENVGDPLKPTPLF